MNVTRNTRLPEIAGLIIAALFLLPACGKAEGETASYYITGSKEQQETFRELFRLLEEERQPGPERFAVLQQIAGEYGRLKEYLKLINFLGALVQENPEDPYTAWYLLMIALAYDQQNAREVSALYYDLIIKNYPDLQIQGDSIHFIALNRLISLTRDQNRLVRYYRELLERFPEKIDTGQIYFLLGQACEKIGDWNAAITAYSRFLPWYGAVIQGFPNAYIYAKQLVDFNNSPKDWTFESLGALVDAIKNALQAGNAWRLWSYRAKVNFFDRSWGQEEDQFDGFSDFNITGFWNNQIRFTQNLDEGSNANEAYLRTWGWSLSLNTWYFYFRKIYFPPDPEIHGRWEWAGIYFGEKW